MEWMIQFRSNNQYITFQKILTKCISYEYGILPLPLLNKKTNKHIQKITISFVDTKKGSSISIYCTNHCNNNQIQKKKKTKILQIFKQCNDAKLKYQIKDSL